MSNLPAWHGELKPSDWMINGEPIRGAHRLLQWEKLDWTRARIDMGPSPAGNHGPYWHVPWQLEGEELWARLYPKLILGKWQPLVQHAIDEAPGYQKRRNAARKKLNSPVISAA